MGISSCMVPKNKQIKNKIKKTLENTSSKNKTNFLHESLDSFIKTSHQNAKYEFIKSSVVDPPTVDFLHSSLLVFLVFFISIICA